MKAHCKIEEVQAEMQTNAKPQELTAPPSTAKVYYVHIHRTGDNKQEETRTCNS